MREFDIKRLAEEVRIHNNLTAEGLESVDSNWTRFFRQGRLNTDFVGLFFDDYKMKVSVRFDRYPVIRYRYQPVITFNDLVYNFGGLVSLWLGYSMVSFLAILDSLLPLIMTFFKFLFRIFRSVSKPFKIVIIFIITYLVYLLSFIKYYLLNAFLFVDRELFEFLFR